ncbi:A-kinase anchor protein 17A isoform X2 [Iris pallida]|uniref:A-kinase anchor protein 17A isoform X2 n=1 Tax=Iris pallida TaxID=29817 RepID=A0AAX6FHT7_IRIPA|nr:A-kinase anchor protein 17A isoform X2 [Iris pallida]
MSIVPSLSPTEPFLLPNSLSLSPRLKLLLTFFRSDPAVRPIDEWQLRNSLLRFLSLPPLSLSVPDDDLLVKKRADLHKRRRDEPVASGTLYVRELGFLKKKKKEGEDAGGGGDEWMRFAEWRESVVRTLGGIELNLEGVGFEMRVEVPEGDDFEKMKRSWEEFQPLPGNRNYLRGAARRPDTIIVQGLPSRWFAEPRVSSKPSMLVSHTIFSAIGKIRKLNVAADDDLGKKGDETGGEIVSGIQCKICVQFETYDDFCDAMKVLCGRSLQKEGSRLKVDYEVAWDRNGFFKNVQQGLGSSHVQKRDDQVPALVGNIRNETRRHRSEVLHSDSSRQTKRFRE